jgi:hypothetical protein
MWTFIRHFPLAGMMKQANEFLVNHWQPLASSLEVWADRFFGEGAALA